MNIFDQIEKTRFPPKHAYNGLEAKFQNASVWFHGRRGSDDGRNTHTPGQFIEGLRLAYAKDKGTFLGGPPVQRQPTCSPPTDSKLLLLPPHRALRSTFRPPISLTVVAFQLPQNDKAHLQPPIRLRTVAIHPPPDLDTQCSTRYDVSSHLTRDFNIINTIFLPFPTCTMYHEIIIKGNIATQVCGGHMCKCGRVKGSEEGFSGRLSGSVEGLCCWMEGVIGTSWTCNYFWFIFCFTHSSIKKSSNVLSAAHQRDLSPQLSCAVIIASDKFFAVWSYFSSVGGNSFCVRSCHAMSYHVLPYLAMPQ